MARLPQPGGDSNTWGTVLNEYLSQSLSTSGALKAGVVGTTQLADDSVTADKIAANAVSTTQIADGSVSSAKLQTNAVTAASITDGSITAAKLASGVIPNTTDKGIRSLAIFYAPPNIANGAYSDDYAAGYFSRFDDVVLGAGLQDPAHAYYASTQAVIQKAKTFNSSMVFWGYVDAGVTNGSGNHSIASIQTTIDQWITTGVTGIFLDLFGYDYGTSRARQNTILNYIHGKGYGALINVWNSDDAFSPSVNATYNPGGTATAATSADVLLLESWVCNSDSYTSPYRATMSDIKVRGDKAIAYRTSLGIRIFASNIMLHTGTDATTLSNYVGLAEGFARAFRLDGTGVSPSNYSSTGSDIGVITPRTLTFGTMPFRQSATYWLNNTWTQVQAPDLGIIVNLDTGTWQKQ